MSKTSDRSPLLDFTPLLYDQLRQLNPGIAELEMYEFCYALDNLSPAGGWDAVQIDAKDELEQRIKQIGFYESIELQPRQNNRVVLDERIISLNQQLFKGLVNGAYPSDWVNPLFYFDIRAFSFFVRTQYFTPAIMAHFGGSPLLQFRPAQKNLESLQDIGYAEFRAANREIDQAFLKAIQTLITRKGTPLLFTLVGPSGAGKSEIVARLQQALSETGRNAVSVEMDNFNKDRSFRDGKPTDSQVIHYELFRKSMDDLLHRRQTAIPRYDFVQATSSHDLNSRLRPAQTMIEIQPADIILLEGNFPFHIPEIAPMIDIKVVYLTDDPIRLKRKWRRDVDYRKKYDPAYLCNRYFKTQILRSREIYQPMMAVCDVVVDTTSAALWVTPEISALL
jgi:uridine kinase